MFFLKRNDDTWVPCGPKQPGAVQITMQELAAQGLASKVSNLCWNVIRPFLILFWAFWMLQGIKSSVISEHKPHGFKLNEMVILDVPQA